jgi:hypothetical protein
MLTFDEAAHQYFWNGAPVPNVTRIIGHLTDYSHIPADRLEIARQEGVAVHRMAELHFHNDLDLAGLYSDPGRVWLAPHYEALMRFIDETGFECWAAEKRMYHLGLGYAGTPDLIGLAKKLTTIKGPALFDIKRSFFGGPAIGLQLVGYRRTWNDVEAKKDKSIRIPDGNRLALQLRKDGTYRIQQFEDVDDDVAFLACLQQHHWRAKHYGRA